MRTTRLTEDLARARHRIGALEEITATEARQLVELQSNLQASNETHENLARQNDKLSYELRTEQTARTTEKVAYDQRTTIHVGQLKEVHQLLDAAKAHLTTREADLQGRITILNEQLSAATARLAAIEQSWASGLIHRLAPAAFKPINPR